MAEKRNTPDIRFEGFTDPWEQCKLGEFCTISKGHGYNKADIRDAGTPLILYGRLYTQYESRIENVDTFAVEQEGSLLSKGNEVIVPASGETAEDIAVASSVRRSGIIFGGDLNVVTPVSKLDPDYIALAITYSKAHDDLAKRAQGKSVVHVHGSDIAEVEIPYPSESEQKRISTVVLGLDNLITLHQRKYDKLCTVKKSMLDKMFPKPGETEPEIRFEGFTDPWEQRKFADFVTASGIRNSENLELPSYSVTNDRGFVLQDEQFENGGTMREADKTSYWIVEPRSFAYNPARINVGSIGYQSTSGNVIVSSLYEVFRTDETCDDRFLWHWFKTRLFAQQIEMLQEGGVRLYFFFDKLLKSVISMPSIDEQRLIGEQFDRLDDLITLHQRKLDLLKNMKKSLLDKMFV